MKKSNKYIQTKNLKESGLSKLIGKVENKFGQKVISKKAMALGIGAGTGIGIGAGLGVKHHLDKAYQYRQTGKDITTKADKMQNDIYNKLSSEQKRSLKNLRSLYQEKSRIEKIIKDHPKEGYFTKLKNNLRGETNIEEENFNEKYNTMLKNVNTKIDNIKTKYKVDIVNNTPKVL